MSQKRVSILGRTFIVDGDPSDRYFREYIQDLGSFADAPIIVADRYCGRDSVIVDIGANIGISTMAFAHIARDGKVIAFEPSPRNFELLALNVRSNQLTNVELAQVALSNNAEVLRLTEDPDFMAGNRVAVNDGSDGANIVDVNATTLDIETSARSLSKIDLIKIDVEGHEQQVLEGGLSTLEKYRPICIVEFNSYTMVYHRGVRPPEFLNFLIRLFPHLYYFDRASYRLRSVRGSEEAFLKQNSETGFVDDLVGAFAELRTG